MIARKVAHGHKLSADVIEDYAARPIIGNAAAHLASNLPTAHHYYAWFV